MLLKCYTSGSHSMLDANGKSEAQVTKYALGEALKRMGILFQSQAISGDTEMPQTIRVWPVKERWDIHVRLYLDKGEASDQTQDTVPQELS